MDLKLILYVVAVVITIVSKALLIEAKSFWHC